MTGNIYLVGFMGSGKSTVAAALSETLNREAKDTDAELSRHFGKPFTEVFAQEGEVAFRTKETAVLKRLAARKRLVIATGGGLPVSDENRRIMAESGKTVFLDAALATCAGRLSDEERASRPLWRDRKAIENLFERRRGIYAEADFTINVDGKTPDRIAEALMPFLLPDESFSVRLGDTECPIIATYNAPEITAKLTTGARTAVITDRTVARLHLGRFPSPAEPVAVIDLPAGERSKTLGSVQRVYEAFIEKHVDRDDLLVALGGGVVTDLAAFVGSTYKRGMRFIIVSTTLLGCVDAAVGGKAAVNLGDAKNVIGCFSIPTAVVLDLRALSTLAAKQIREGLVEAYKTGLIAAPELADFIERETEPLVRGDLPLLGHVAVKAAKIKAGVVSQDFRESGLRRILNFGHTFGHAVEAFNRFKISHGAGVAAGMVLASRLSRIRGMIDEDTDGRIVSAIRRIYPGAVELPSPDEALELMRHDKKIRGGRLVFVLLEEVGRAVCVDDVTREELVEALAAVKEDTSG
ncbi:MAG: 3-dehydroquinate synthase [Pseudomonadota bacterium]